MNTSDLELFPMAVVHLKPIPSETGSIRDFLITRLNSIASELPTSPRQGQLLFADGVTAREHLLRPLLEHVMKSGQTRSKSFSATSGPYAGRTLYFSASPAPGGVALAIQNISRIWAEFDEIKSRNTLLQAAPDYAADGVFISDANGVLIYANPSLSSLVGYNQDEMVGKLLVDMIHPDYAVDDRHLVRQLLNGEIDKYLVDRLLLARSGETVLVSASISLAWLKDRRVHALIGHVRDVREERQQSEQLEKALEEAKAATRMKSEFLANMSHEIRTPLNGILGMSQVVACTDLDDDQKDYVQTILESGQSLLSILNDILDFSKIEAGKLDISPVESNLRMRLESLDRLYRPTAAEKGLDFKVVVHPSVPEHLVFDPVRVRQCIENLVTNAIKFTTEGGIKIISTAQPDEDGSFKVTTHIIDTGIGMSKCAAARVFEAFTQADGSTTRTFGGTGLGLPISKSLARAMGGDVTVASEEGKGSIFTLTFTADTPEAIAMPWAERKSA